MDQELALFDAWVNPNLGTPSDPRYDVGYLFPDLAERWRRTTTIPQLVEEMDAGNVQMAALCCGYGMVDGADDEGYVLDALGRHPDRFIGTVAVDPTDGMAAVRKVERLVGDHDFKMVRMVAFEIGLPYDHPAYYPVYAKCAELGVAVGLNVGLCGPLIASAVQDPLPIDQIAAFFPELRIVMQHGGDPWIDVCVKLLLKWPNVFYMTSAWSPKRIPQPILHLANTRGPEKVMFASDYPLLTFERCATEIAALPFRTDVHRRNFAYDNARRVLLGDGGHQERSEPARTAADEGAAA